jgi:hypothetical protein
MIGVPLARTQGELTPLQSRFLLEYAKIQMEDQK